MMSGPGSFFALSPKGPLWGAVKAWDQLHVPDTLHVAYLNLTTLSLGSKQSHWQPRYRLFKRALSRASYDVM